MRSIFKKEPMQTPEGRKQNSPGRRRYAMARPNLRIFRGLGAGRDVCLAESGLQPWERYTLRNRPERASDLEPAFEGHLGLPDEPARTRSAALSGRFPSVQIPRAKALGCSVFALRAKASARALICISVSLSGCARIGSYAPSLDVYGSYFPAWLICLIAGVILTVLASQIGRFLNLSQLRKFGPLIPISLILIFSIATWFLFFAS
jgi:hypothetical protein